MVSRAQPVAGNRPAPHRRGCQRRVIGQQLPVQPPQLRPRVKTEFGGEHAARPVIRGQRLTAAATSPQRHHQLSGQPFPQRERLGQRRDFRDRFAVPAERQGALDPLLDDRCPRLLKPRCLARQPETPGRRVLQRRAPPQRQRFAEQSGSPGRVTGLRRASRAFRQGGELLYVQASRIQPQEITVTRPDDPRAPAPGLGLFEQPPQRRDPRVQVLLPSGRCVPSPQPVDQRRHTHCSPRRQAQHPSKHPQQLLRDRRHLLACQPDSHRAEQRDRQAYSRPLLHTHPRMVRNFRYVHTRMPGSASTAVAQRGHIASTSAAAILADAG
jgi:hypothetical protein